MSMSSTILAHWNPSMTELDMRHQLSDDEDMPIGRERYRYHPDGRRKVMRNEDSSLRGTCKYLLTESRLAKNCEVEGIDCRISFVLGNECTGLSIFYVEGQEVRHESYLAVWLSYEECVAAPCSGFRDPGDDSLADELFDICFCLTLITAEFSRSQYTCARQIDSLYSPTVPQTCKITCTKVLAQ